jgi:hypothetical protein
MPYLTTVLASWKASLDLLLRKQKECESWRGVNRDHSACERGIFARARHGSGKCDLKENIMLLSEF